MTNRPARVPALLTVPVVSGRFEHFLHENGAVGKVSVLTIRGAAFILSQKHEGWTVSPTLYDDGGFSGATLERPALKRLLTDIEAGLIDVVVVYKIDRLSRALMDFSKLVEIFERHGVTFVSVTQSFNTTNSMGRLTLNILLSFAQFEREVIGERIRDKVAASRRRGLWMGGVHAARL
jgi:site-specific DNA recombinase